MKTKLLLVILTGFCYVSFAQQLDSTGKSHVNFGVDADTRNNYQKISTQPYSSTMHHDDWFLQDGYKRYDIGGTGLGNSVFDTVGAAAYKAQLQAGQNISFVKRMKVAAFDVLPMWRSPNPALGFDSSFWVDGIYYRDYAGGIDETSFSGGKNADNPSSWSVGNNVSGKTDIVDVYTHVRTSGINPVRDSVWFFAGVSTVKTEGNRFFDIEVYRENITYNETTKQFSSAGLLGGHSSWNFNDTGKVTQSGDIIISVAYQAGRAPEIDFRIFISKSAYDSVVAGKLVPTSFKIVTNQWDLNTSGTGGYVQILSKSGITDWGSGTANYIKTNTAAQDSTHATPWGTMSTSGGYSDNYERLQFIEIALNFSRFGMNPFHYVTSYCKSPYSSIIVKSRASTSFTANLEDFVIPQPFSVKNLAPFTVKEDTVSCAAPTAKFEITASARNYYRWYDENGAVLRADSDLKTFSPSKSGTYYIEATNFQGCPTMTPRKEIKIYVDSTAPTAKALLGWGQPYYFLNGEGAFDATSSPSSGFGPSKGLSYSWIGPDGFTASVEDPILGNTKSDFSTGNYTVTVQEARNGCTASALIYVDVAVLSTSGIELKGSLKNEEVKLVWNILDLSGSRIYDIERSTNGVRYEKTGQVTGIVGTTHFTFIDYKPLPGVSYYRIKGGSNGNTPKYSNAVSLQNDYGLKAIISRQISSNQVHLQFKKTGNKTIQVKVLSTNGSLLLQHTYSGSQQTIISLPPSVANLPVIIAVYEAGNFIEARKL